MGRVVILARHGNTFQTGEKVVMVGASQDPALTEFGRSQARALGAALAEYREAIGFVSCGPLTRTTEYARLVLEACGAAPAIVIDPRLTELDYGAWGGLSDQEIISLCGSRNPLEAWQERGERPTRFEFRPSEQVLEQEVTGLLADLATRPGVSLVITSNGRLRECGRLLSPHESRSWKVGTGKVCVLECVNDAWTILAWDVPPETLSEILPCTVTT